MRALAVVSSVGVVLAWVWFLTTPHGTPMGLEDEIERGRMLTAAALTAASLVAVAALIGTRRA